MFVRIRHSSRIGHFAENKTIHIYTFACWVGEIREKICSGSWEGEERERERESDVDGR